MRTRVLLALLATGLALPQAAPADEVVFANGQRRQGRVEAVEGASDRIALITSTGRIEIPRDRIAEIIENDDATDFAIIGNQFLASGNIQNALGTLSFTKAGTGSMLLSGTANNFGGTLKIAGGSLAGSSCVEPPGAYLAS